MDVLLVRHGQTRWNREQVFRGSIDVELDETGRRQAELLGRALSGRAVTAVYSSPLRRAADTAEAIARPHGLAVATVPAMTDMSFGQWEGKADGEVRDRWPDLYRMWRAEPWRVSMPGGDDLEAVAARSLGALREIVSRHEARDTVVVASHRVVLKVLILGLLGIGTRGFWNIRLSPCGLSTFEHDGTAFVLTGCNEICHLQEMDSRLADF